MTNPPSDRRSFLKLAGSGAVGLGAGSGALLSRRSSAQDMRTLVVAGDSDIDTLDPHSFKSIGAYLTQVNIYDSPLTWKVQPVQDKPGIFLSKPAEYEGGVCESWAFEKEGATVVLKVRQGIKFPNGRPVDASTLKYMFDRCVGSPGYMRIVYPLLTKVSDASKFVVRDAYTIAMEMPAPTPLALEVLSLLTNSLIDPEEVKAHATSADPWAAEWMKRNTAGLGPYRLVKNEPGSEVVLEATPNHWRGKPYFDRVVIKFVPSEADRILLLKRKAVDIVSGRPGLSPRSIKSLEGEPGLRIVTLPDTVCHWLCMNTAKAPFNNAKVRQAINYAIPIQAILPNVVQGYGTQMKSPLPSLMPGHLASQSPYKYDLEKARALMRESGVAGGTPLELSIRVGWQPHEQAATWIQPELEKLGFKVTIEKKSDAAFRQASMKGDQLLSIEAWQSWVNDPFFHLFFNFHSKATGTNSSKYANPELDKLIDENMHEIDPAKRMAAAHRAQQLLIDEGVWGFLWYDNWTRVMSANLTGIEKRWDTFDRFYAMKRT